MSKRLAIQLFGHLRTFEYAFESFRKNVLEVNKADGWEIDIFIHTWDEIEHSDKVWHNENTELRKQKVTNEIIKKIETLYKPKAISITNQKEGENQNASKGISEGLRLEYEKQNNIQYDCVFFTRYDIFFIKPLRLNTYTEAYKNEELMHSKVNPVAFYASSLFIRFNIFDTSRCIPEGNLIWFYKAIDGKIGKDSDQKCVINYTLNKDFAILRSRDIKNDKIVPVTFSIDEARHISFKKLFLRIIAGFVPLRKLRRKIRGQG